MLILTRFQDESIIITSPSGRVEITLMHVGRDGKVRLGFNAPKCIVIHRKEIQLRIDKENEKGEPNGIEPNMPS